MTRFTFLALSLLSIFVEGSKQESLLTKDTPVEISPESDIGRHLLSKARRVDDSGIDTSFMTDYSFKFQGCHHIQQWNPNAGDDEDSVRIMTKRLVRFRLCPYGSCNSEKTAGCSSGYGDYVVDLETFLDAYIEAVNEMSYYNRKLEDGGFDLAAYSSCTEYADGYYIGPYCGSQGGAIQLGVFSDDTCSTFASSDYYYYMTGSSLPFSDTSLVSSTCITCGDQNVNEFCGTLYESSGKCETKMKIEYPNKSACSYIDGVKIIREDGVIRTSANRKSKIAAACIGIFLSIAVVLAGYVYYLRTKLSRAHINLMAASEPLA